MWKTKSNFDVIQNKAHTQVFHNYHLQIIQGIQPTMYLNIVALDTPPFKWQSLIHIHCKDFHRTI